MTEIQDIHIHLSVDKFFRRIWVRHKYNIYIYLFFIFIAATSDKVARFNLSGTLIIGTLLLLNFWRLTFWVVNAIKTIDTDTSGIKICYYKKDNIEETTIKWSDLKIELGSTFTKSPSRCLKIWNADTKVGNFYSLSYTFDDKYVEDLYATITKLKKAYA